MKKILSLLLITLSTCLFSQTGVTPLNQWKTNGNAISTNTNFIGTTTNRSLNFYSNNIKSGSLDSLNKWNFGIGSVVNNTTSLGIVRIRQGNSFIDLGERSNLSPAIWFNNTNNSLLNSTTNWAISGSTLATVINGPISSIDFRIASANIFIARGTQTTGANSELDFIGLGGTNLTASSNIPYLKLTPATSQRSTGNITTDYAYYFRARALSAVGTSSVTYPYGAFFEAQTASTNMSFGTTFGIGTNSNAHVTGSIVIGGAAKTPSATLDVTGTMSVSSTSSLNGLQLTSGSFSVTSKVIDVTAGDAATINSPVGRFRKDATGTTFVLTNSQITANSIIILTNTTAGITTGNQLSVVAGAGSCTITFETAGIAGAPSANMDINFIIMN